MSTTDRFELRSRAADVHAYHNGLPGFSEQQIWHDGCPVCEARGALVAIWQIDPITFQRAWRRANEWQRHGLADIADCERPLLETLAACRNQGLVYMT